MKYVKVIIERNGKEETLFGDLISEDEFSIKLKFKSGEIITIGKRNLVKMFPKKKVKDDEGTDW